MDSTLEKPPKNLAPQAQLLSCVLHVTSFKLKSGVMISPQGCTREETEVTLTPLLSQRWLSLKVPVGIWDVLCSESVQRRQFQGADPGVSDVAPPLVFVCPGVTCPVGLHVPLIWCQLDMALPLCSTDMVSAGHATLVLLSTC